MRCPAPRGSEVLMTAAECKSTTAATSKCSATNTPLKARARCRRLRAQRPSSPDRRGGGARSGAGRRTGAERLGPGRQRGAEGRHRAGADARRTVARSGRAPFGRAAQSARGPPQRLSAGHHHAGRHVITCALDHVPARRGGNPSRGFGRPVPVGCNRGRHLPPAPTRMEGQLEQGHLPELLLGLVDRRQQHRLRRTGVRLFSTLFQSAASVGGPRITG